MTKAKIVPLPKRPKAWVELIEELRAGLHMELAMVAEDAPGDHQEIQTRLADAARNIDIKMDILLQIMARPLDAEWAELVADIGKHLPSNVVQLRR